MKLTYRGVAYDYTPPAVETQVTGDAGHYRGVDIRFRTVKKAPVQQPTLDLVYRGVAYHTGNAVEEVAVAPAVAAPAPVAAEPVAAVAAVFSSVEDKARTMLMGHHRNVKRRQQAMLGRLATEVGLPEDAAKYWNHIQGKVHPSFWATYDRGHAAAS